MVLDDTNDLKDWKRQALKNASRHDAAIRMGVNIIIYYLTH